MYSLRGLLRSRTSSSLCKEDRRRGSECNMCFEDADGQCTSAGTSNEVEDVLNVCVESHGAQSRTKKHTLDPEKERERLGFLSRLALNSQFPRDETTPKTSCRQPIIRTASTQEPPLPDTGVQQSSSFPPRQLFRRRRHIPCELHSILRRQPQPLRERAVPLGPRPALCHFT